ncbi:hypothetical protein V501_08129 [Pseudogymnoascus sp. VKM F-4519 (FW-2642)]|nr:hypothetical protein V501_08129 [Pseudogymnoascus sp. VKM F-4519 (FW-2642)]
MFCFPSTLAYDNPRRRRRLRQTARTSNMTPPPPPFISTPPISPINTKHHTPAHIVTGHRHPPPPSSTRGAQIPLSSPSSPPPVTPPTTRLISHHPAPSRRPLVANLNPGPFYRYRRGGWRWLERDDWMGWGGAGFRAGAWRGLAEIWWWGGRGRLAQGRWEYCSALGEVQAVLAVLTAVVPPHNWWEQLAVCVGPTHTAGAGANSSLCVMLTARWGAGMSYCAAVVQADVDWVGGAVGLGLWDLGAVGAVVPPTILVAAAVCLTVLYAWKGGQQQRTDDADSLTD